MFFFLARARAEAAAAARVAAAKDNQAQLKVMFDRFDVDGNGQLSASEVAVALASAGLPVSQVSSAA